MLNIKYQISKLPNHPLGMMTSSIFHFTLCILIFLFLVLSGCNKANEKAQMLEQINQLTEQNTQLTSRIEQSESQNKQLTERVQVLSGLPEKVKGENLYNIQKIEIHRLTDFYDKDEEKDGRNETLIVHVQPTDDQLDVIKAIGEVDVQLWDLNQPDGQAMLAEWNVGPEELKKTWTVTMFTISYRLTFDIAEIVKSFGKPLTVKVKFTDYLTGKVFEEQKAIEPQSP